MLKQEGTARRIESMQQSSATPSLHLWFLGVAEDYCMLSILLAVPWHGVIPTSYFIFNDFYTCIYYPYPITLVYAECYTCDHHAGFYLVGGGGGGGGQKFICNYLCAL